jgi:hypothetical protein
VEGAAYVFTKPSSGWATTSTFSAKQTAADGSAYDEFGRSVALSGDGKAIVAGAVGHNSAVGAAYVFGPGSLASLSTSSLSFPSQPVGTTSSAQMVTLTNTGSGPLHVTSVTASSYFATTTQCVTASPLAMNASCTESVTFAPTVTGGPLTGTLAFTDDSGGTQGSTQSVSLTGTGVKAATTATISSLMPSPSVAGQAVTASFSVLPPSGDTLTPTGTVTVKATTGESCSGGAPSGSCALTFAAAGPRTITASYGGDANFLGSNSGGLTQNVSDFSISVTPSSQTIPAGQSARYNITLTAINGFSGSVSLGCSGGPPHSSCSVSPAMVSLPGSSMAKATVSLATPQNVNIGTFPLTFTGTDSSAGALRHTAPVSLTVK